MDGQRVLVVDDEPHITDLVAMALRYEGFEVESAATGRAALKAVEDFRPELIILDVMLPDLDGFAVTERLTNERVDVPILFLTARDAVEDKVRGLTLGGDDYVTKPFSLEELVARVRVLLRRSSRGRIRPTGVMPRRSASPQNCRFLPDHLSQFCRRLAQTSPSTEWDLSLVKLKCCWARLVSMRLAARRVRVNSK